MQLSDKFPFLINYFNESVKNQSYSNFQSILFYGSDLEAQYKLALYVAKLLNCNADLDVENCNCQNCRWIDEQTHPAVMTLSKYDGKPEDDESKTVISLKQAQYVKNSLNTSSDYHRVFIFCDKNKNGEILGLNRINFQEEAVNSLLKIIEEPPSKTTFIFLTRNKNDVLSTIQSRCMSFFVPAFEKIEYRYDLVQEIFENYLEFNRQDVFDIATELYNLSKEVGADKVLISMQNYILNLMKSNLENKFLTIKLREDLANIELAKNAIKVEILPQKVFEDLCLKIIK